MSEQVNMVLLSLLRRGDALPGHQEEAADLIDALHAEAEALRALAAFALELIDGAWEGASFDGGDVQEAGVRHGLLAVERREESCGEHCSCAEHGFPIECYRLTPAIAANRQAQGKASEQ